MVVADPTGIAVERFYRHPPERVWEAANTPAVIADWSNDVRPAVFEPGSRFGFTIYPIPMTRYTGRIECQFTHVRLNESMAFTYSMLGGHEPWTTRVAYVLQPRAGGTELHIHQVGFDADNREHSRVRLVLERAWLDMLDRVADVLEGRLAAEGGKKR